MLRRLLEVVKMAERLRWRIATATDFSVALAEAVLDFVQTAHEVGEDLSNFLPQDRRNVEDFLRATKYEESRSSLADRLVKELRNSDYSDLNVAAFIQCTGADGKSFKKRYLSTFNRVVYKRLKNIYKRVFGR